MQDKTIVLSDSIGVAERDAFIALCSITGSEDGVNAFLLDTPQRANSWAFSFTGTPQNVPSFIKKPAKTIPFTARARGIFTDRRQMWNWVGLLVEGLEIRQCASNSPLEFMRINSIGAVNESFMTFPNETISKFCYTIDLSFQVTVRMVVKNA